MVRSTIRSSKSIQMRDMAIGLFVNRYVIGLAV